MTKLAIHLALLAVLSVAGGACLSDDARSDREAPAGFPIQDFRSARRAGSVVD